MLFYKEKIVKIIFFFYIYGKNYNGWSVWKNCRFRVCKLINKFKDV